MDANYLHKKYYEAPSLLDLALQGLPKYWQQFFAKIRTTDAWHDLDAFLKRELDLSNQTYPLLDDIFAAFKNLPTDFSLLILGQDPYHGSEIINGQMQAQAHGLAFSVPHGFKIPPSLRNIDIELQQSLNTKTANHGCLTAWRDQGVLLLNTALTVRAKQAATHALAWRALMRLIIEKLILEHDLICVLWGNHAQSYEELILKTAEIKNNIKNNISKHEGSEFPLILKAVHPSPLSARRGFFGCGHFLKINQFLYLQGKKIIDWQR